VLSLSKLENQSILTDKKTYNVSEQIRLVIAIMYSKWSERDIEIDFDRGELLFTANEELMKQVFINLLDNAVKFSPDGSIIKVLILEKVNSLIFIIKDQGVGMDEDNTSRIFDKFYQGDASHAGSGNGLGMTIVGKIVSLHGGTIRIDTAPGKGTTFEIEGPKPKSPLTAEEWSADFQTHEKILNHSRFRIFSCISLRIKCIKTVYAGCVLYPA